MFIRSINRKSTLIIYVIAPVIALIIPLVFYSNINEKSTIGVVDNDNSYISKQIIDDLSNNKGVKVELLTKNEAIRYLAQNKIISFINIPKIYCDNTLKNYVNKIELYALQENNDIETLKIELEMLASKIYSAAANTINEDDFIQVYKSINNNEMTINKKEIDVEMLDQIVIGFIVMFLIIIYTNSLSTIIKDRNDKVYKKVLLTSTSSNEYILGQLLWNSILLLVQSTVLIVFMKIFKLQIGIEINKFLYLLIITGILAIAIGVFIISLCNNENQISIISTLIIFPSSMLSGSFWPIEIMNDSLQKVSLFFPQRYIFRLVDLLQNNSEILEIILTTILIILMSILIMYFGLIRLDSVREDYI